MAESERERRIRERAYRLWEEQGRPEGRHEHHWRLAAQEEEDAGAEERERIDRGGALDGGLLETGGLVAGGGPAGAGLGGLGMTEEASGGPSGFDSGATAAEEVAAPAKPKRAPRKPKATGGV